MADRARLAALGKHPAVGDVRRGEITAPANFSLLAPAYAAKYGLAEDIEVDTQGLVHAVRGPGLGAVIDFGLIERKKVAVLS